MQDGFPFSDEANFELPEVIPVLPLEEAVVFPYIVVPLSLGPEKGILAVDQALGDNRLVLLVNQKEGSGHPLPDQLNEVGTVSMILRMLKLPDGRVRILVQGLVRAQLEQLSQTEPYLRGRVKKLESPDWSQSDLEGKALVRNVRDHLEKAMHLGKNISPEILVVAANLEDPGRLADLAASNLELEAPEAQKLLEIIEPMRRLIAVNELLLREVEVLQIQATISSQARDEIDRSQRDFFLRQQLKAIQLELGDRDEFAEEIAEYQEIAESKGLPEEAQAELGKQIRRLERSHPDSAESSVIRAYLDWLTGLPWSTLSSDNLDLEHARSILDSDHFGLERVKERIIELLAVRKLKPNSKGPILCFVGPPGVGKTSLGRSIAQALDRKFVRVSLGGVRDEAEVRGHRRTYVGSMPGRIIQGIHQAGTSNPVFMLDEIDKIGGADRGDPSSALLEVLDSEQNTSYRDHYLGLGYNLSQVLFITTANLLEPIQPAFLDRMEVIRLSGYTEDDKLEIAKRHLIPRQLAENGIHQRNLQFSKAGLKKIIRGYTREAGLRNLERELAAICRKVAVKVTRGKHKRVSVDKRQVKRLLGPPRHFNETLLEQHRIGVATGLAWTANGGDLLIIETVAVPGKGRLRLTGQLGDVMKESVQTALSFARTLAPSGRFDAKLFTEHDIHVHAPAGSIPKDGPSAGITIATAIVSMLTRLEVDRKIAMTGEITLRGVVLPIGGLKEKALAAHAAGIESLIVPKHNQIDLVKLPVRLKKKLTFHFVETMEDVLSLALIGWKPTIKAEYRSKS